MEKTLFLTILLVNYPLCFPQFSLSWFKGKSIALRFNHRKMVFFFQSSQGWTFIYPDYPDCFFFLKSCWMIGGKSIDPLIHWWWMIQWLLVESWWIPWSGWIPLAQYKSWWFRVPPLFFCMYDILQLSSTWSKCMPNYTMHGAYGEIISQVLLANIQLLLYIYIPFSLVKSPFLLGKSIHLA